MARTPPASPFENRLQYSRRAAVAALGSVGLSPSSAWAQQGAHPLDLSLLEKRRGGRVGLVMLDSQTGRSVAWRSNERFAYCSTFKLFLAAASLQRVARGSERMDRLVRVRNSDLVDYSPVTEKAAGSALPIGELLRAAVSLSDNCAANLLIEAFGGLAAWRNWYRAIGDRITRVDRLEIELNRGFDRDPRDTTTPAQALHNLRSVFEGPLLTDRYRRQLIDWLVDTPRGTARIKAGVPAGWTVAHKAGTGSQGQTNDIGLVWPTPARRPIIAAAYYSGSAVAAMDQREAVLAEAVRKGIAGLAIQSVSERSS